MKRMLKTLQDSGRSQCVESDPNNADIFLPHWVLDIYPNHPDELEPCCLHDLLGCSIAQAYTA